MSAIEQQIKESYLEEFPPIKPTQKTAKVQCVCGRWIAKCGYKTIMLGTKEACINVAKREGFAVEFI